MARDTITQVLLMNAKEESFTLICKVGSETSTMAAAFFSVILSLTFLFKTR